MRYAKACKSCTVSKAVPTELSKAISLLNKISTYTEQKNLKDFKEAFAKRYEDQEISLLNVLDNETGIGYPVNATTTSDSAPLLANLLVNVGNTIQSSNHQSTNWSSFLWSKLQVALKHGSCEIEITDTEFQSVFKDQDSGEGVLPDSIYTLGSIMAGSNDELDKGNF